MSKVLCYTCKVYKSIDCFSPSKVKTRKRTGRKVGLCKPCNAAYTKDFINNKSYYGIKLHVGLEELKRLQDNKCAICNCSTRLVIDHCHKTEIIRGLLCYSCNSGLGMFKDNPELLRNAINYILKREPN